MDGCITSYHSTPTCAGNHFPPALALERSGLVGLALLLGFGSSADTTILHFRALIAEAEPRVHLHVEIAVWCMRWPALTATGLLSRPSPVYSELEPVSRVPSDILCLVTAGRIGGEQEGAHYINSWNMRKKTSGERFYTTTVIDRGIRRCKVRFTYTLGRPGLRLGFTRPSRSRIPPGPTPCRIPVPEIRVCRCIISRVAMRRYLGDGRTYQLVASLLACDLLPSLDNCFLMVKCRRSLSRPT